MGQRRALRERYRQVLDFITQYAEERGYPPSIREIGTAIHDGSTSHVNYIIRRLEDLGYLTRDAGLSRGIRLPAKDHSIRVQGRIAAGQPLEMFDTPEEHHLILPEGTPPQAYALRVKGNSMIEDHIDDGDFVIVVPERDVPNGTVVVATNRDPDSGSAAATLKRFYRHGKHIRLQPANSELSPIEIPADEWDRAWEIQGRLLAVVRDYGLIH